MIKYQDVICMNDFQLEVSLVLGNRKLMYFRVNSELGGGGTFGIILCRADIFGASQAIHWVARHEAAKQTMPSFTLLSVVEPVHKQRR